MKTVVPIRNKQAVREFIQFTNQVYADTGGNYSAIATNTNGMMQFMKLLGYEGDIDELIKDMITQNQKSPLYERNGKHGGLLRRSCFCRHLQAAKSSNHGSRSCS